MKHGKSYIIHMMSNRSQVIEIIRLVTLLMGGLGTASAYAQAPTFSPPPLPGLPSVPNAPTPSGASITPPPTTSAPAIDVSAIAPVPGADQPDALSDLAGVGEKKPTITPPTSGASLSDLPKPVPVPESSDMVGIKPPALVTTMPTFETVAPPPLSITPLAPPGSITAITPATTTSPLPPLITAPTDTAAAPETKRKSWQTTLAPTIKIPTLGYHYRRVLLPADIYRTSYNYDNSHLPVRVTREDYERLLVASAARNDINATRALLNAGASNSSAALAAARSHGAYDTAALLEARGAR